MNNQDEYPFARPRELEWLASRGPCDPQTATEYVGHKLLSQETFQQVQAFGFSAALLVQCCKLHSGGELSKGSPGAENCRNVRTGAPGGRGIATSIWVAKKSRRVERANGAETKHRLNKVSQ
jgi:hypothetical protein